MLNVQEAEQLMHLKYQKEKAKSNIKPLIKSENCTSLNDSYDIDYTKFRILALILPFGLDSVIAKPSKIHGFGVFSKRNILKDELMTFYPADFIECSPNKDRHVLGNYVLSYRSIRFEKRFGVVFNAEVRDNDYAYCINQTYTIIGEKTFNNDPNYLGHLINDSAKSNSTEESDKIYTVISSKKANCKFYNLDGGLHVAIIATKDIKKGEELFVTYGAPYWNFHNENMRDELEVKIRCMTCHIYGQKLKKCGRCRSVYYCSAECQKTNWKEHKKICGD